MTKQDMTDKAYEDRMFRQVTITIEQFQDAIISLFEDVSPISFPVFHSLMQDYANMLIALRQDSPDADQLKKSFLERLARKGFRTAGKMGWGKRHKEVRVKLMPDGEMLRNGMGERYNGCLIDRIAMQKREYRQFPYPEPWIYAVSPLDSDYYTDPKGRKTLVEKILAGETNLSNLFYPLCFPGHPDNDSEVEFGDKLNTLFNADSVDVEKKYVKLQSSLCLADVVIFPEGSPFDACRYDTRDSILYFVVAKLGYKPDLAKAAVS